MEHYRTTAEKEHPVFRKARKAQPAGLFAFFAIIGIALLFLSILVMFAMAAPVKSIGIQNFPWLFYISTPFILFCSYTIEKTKRAFRDDDAEALLKFQLWTLAASMIFCVVQFFAWRQLWSSGITMFTVEMEGVTRQSNSGAYVYVLSGLHALHVLGGLCFLFASMFHLVNNRDDLVKSVVYFSDRREGGRIAALAMYWHFLGGLWMVMCAFFFWIFSR